MHTYRKKEEGKNKHHSTLKRFSYLMAVCPPFQCHIEQYILGKRIYCPKKELNVVFQGNGSIQVSFTSTITDIHLFCSEKTGEHEATVKTHSNTYFMPKIIQVKYFFWSFTTKPTKVSTHWTHLIDLETRLVSRRKRELSKREVMSRGMSSLSCRQVFSCSERRATSGNWL